MNAVINNVGQAKSIVGTLSKPSKMPGHAYSIPAQRCITGSKLRHIKGSVCSKCYALKGRYHMKTVQKAMNRRFESLADPLWVDAMTYLIQQTKDEYFRWHDSGDLQGVWHLKNIVEIAERLPKVKFWIPTREYSIVSEFVLSGGVLPPNLTVRLSSHMIDGPAPESVAKRIGAQISGVSSTPSFTCPASEQDNKCGSCRACWNPNVFNVTYKKH
jgi:hypothetical protein